MKAKGTDSILHFENVGLRRAGIDILSQIDWTVHAGQKWIVLGPNGAGKTVLISTAIGYLYPTSGRVRIFGQELGTFDIRKARSRIGYLSHRLSARLPEYLTALDVVMTGEFGALDPAWHNYTKSHKNRAYELLEQMNCQKTAGRFFADCSSGERQRIALARTLMPNPKLLLLDEPAAGLDLNGREDLIGSLSGLDKDLTCVLITHHTEEIPPDFSNLALLNNGKITASGPIQKTLSEDNLRRCFGRAFKLTHSNGRWWTQAV